MGTQAQVFMKDTGVYLYQHWDGYDLPNVVRRALCRNERWSDTDYLTRIIFCQMVSENNEITTATGYGISTNQKSDIEYLITLTPDKKVIVAKSVYDQSMTDDIKLRWTELFNGTFQEFVDDKRTEW